MLACVAVSCASDFDPYADPDGVQLSLFGDRRCSDPISGEVAGQCCQDHDLCFALGGTEQDFAICNAAFLDCMLRWDVPPHVAESRWLAVRDLGRRSFRWHDQRTNGPRSRDCAP